ncbi:MAG: hypothetical protein R2734_11695 [Nocardioides sp.]
MATYSGTDEFEGATFVKTSFKGARVRFSDFSGVTMRSVDVGGLDLDSHDLFFGSLVVNGVDVVPLVDAELNRQFPGRELQKAQTPDGLREGWVAVRSAWRETVEGTAPDLADAHVEDEWSLAQTLRHLILATDAWLRGAILRIPSPSTRSARYSPVPSRWASTHRSSARICRRTTRSWRCAPIDSGPTSWLRPHRSCWHRSARTRGAATGVPASVTVCASSSRRSGHTCATSVGISRSCGDRTRSPAEVIPSTSEDGCNHPSPGASAVVPRFVASPAPRAHARRFPGAHCSSRLGWESRWFAVLETA